MNVKILTTRYKTPSLLKIIGTILFITVVVLMIVLPVFELIPQDEYINVVNLKGEFKDGASYSSETYTIFTMMENDYTDTYGIALSIMMTQTIVAGVVGIALLWMNRPKIAMVPAAVIFWTIIFSVFRATKTILNDSVPAKLFGGNDFWDMVGASTDIANKGTYDENSLKGVFMQQYTKDGKDYIFNQFGRYWLLWIAGILLIAGVIVAIVLTKTMIEKKKK